MMKKLKYGQTGIITFYAKKYKKFIVENKTILFKQKTKVIDIDYLDDFKICEFRVKNKIFN